jgi:predicted nucleic acid-binding Zn ribbon protein
VLTPEQCQQYRLPRTPIKDEETRKDVFEARFGEGATELDALEALHPGELQRLLEIEIARYYDFGLERRIDAAVSDVQADLYDINEDVERRHAKAIKSLEAERKKVLEAIVAFEKKARPVLNAIEQDLDAEAPDVDNYEWPEADDGDEDDDPLYDSSRDYVEQIDRYKAHQGKTTEFKTTELVCVQCGEAFTAGRSHARFCSRKCRRVFLFRSVKTMTERACIVCGTMFKTGRKESKFCSDKCKSADYRKRHAG